MGLARHLISLFGLFLFSVLLIVSAAVIFQGKKQAEAQSILQSEYLLRLIALNIEPQLNVLDKSELELLLAQNAKAVPVRLLALTVEATDDLFYQYYQKQEHTVYPAILAQQISPVSLPIRTVLTNQQGQRFVLTLQLQPPVLVPFIVELLVFHFCIFVVFLIVLILYIKRFAHSITQPLSALALQSKALSHKHYPVLKAVKSVKEVESLVVAHNEMTEQVKAMISELSERLELAKKSLYKDELTQLGNRRLFIAQLNQVLFENEQHAGALVFIRLNQFEVIRQQEGFQVARAFMEDIIHLSQLTLRQDANVPLYRVNEYEFACILIDVLQDDVIDLIKHLALEFVELQNRYQRKKQVLIGATVFKSQQSLSEILIRVDDALSMAKKEPHLYHFNPENSMLSQVSAILKSREAVLQVIEESVLNFCQQKVMLSDQLNVMFAEVLSAFEFQQQAIPAKLLQSQAEKFSCVEYFDKRIIEMVKSAYLKNDLLLPVSINLSPYSMMDEKFTNWLTDLSHTYADFFSSVIWEFDEASLGQIQNAAAIVHKLQSLGSRVAVDHFGMGENTLKMLRLWHIDIIKIDGSFIHDLGTDRANWSFLETIIQLAHSLGIIVVCEQVESEQESNWARQLGVDGLQGFQIAHPMSNFNLRS
ncbi:EAL domain-containing protein [Pseudoalteromonas tunicata]|uniref:EAL domain-containing protein n=1 Tax=Pseudoalteromonas tunicata TaxID=314281 RepID=UPI00273F24CE|nr:EAL domain-containing protein [Pseudoalteromonas tunicata]MDP5214616.1 EAL domain-containing protein [Pseudoalteromonas tunicata]